VVLVDVDRWSLAFDVRFFFLLSAFFLWFFSISFFVVPWFPTRISPWVSPVLFRNLFVFFTLVHAFSTVYESLTT